jgi:protein-disulfide isomerase
MQEGTALGVGSTPTVFINGRLLTGAQPYEAFRQIIDDELQRAGRR